MNKVMNQDDLKRPDGSCCIDKDVVYIGGLLSKNDAFQDWKECQRKCEQTDECRWFNWDPPTATKKAWCWLKIWKGRRTRIQTGSISGPKRCTDRIHPGEKNIILKN